MLHVVRPTTDLSPEDVEDGVLIPTVAVRDPEPVFEQLKHERVS